MEKVFLDEFINEIELLSKSRKYEDYVEDSSGIYQKCIVLEHLVSEARELVSYGEYKIALENILDNLHEVSITLDKKIIALARKAIGEKVTADMEVLLKVITK